MKIIGVGHFILLLQVLNADGNAWKNEGREFGLGFPPTFGYGSSGTCQLVITSRFSGTAFVYALGSNTSYSITAYQRTVVPLSATLRPGISGYSDKAVYISSDVDAVVQAFSYVPETGTSGGQQTGIMLYPALPGEEYVLHTRSESHSVTDPHAFYTVVGMEDNTVVDVYSPRSGGGYDLSSTITLNKGRAFCSTTASDGDYTGYKLVSSKRAFVTCGHSNLVLTIEASWRTQAVGSLVYPVSVLGLEYLVPGIAGTDAVGGRIRVVAATSGDTTVTRNGANPVGLKEGQKTEFSFSDQTVPSYVTCSQPCSVTLYTLQDNGGNLAGTIQLPILPEKDYTGQSFVFSTPDTQDATKHFISIVVIGDDTSGILLDGSPVSLTWTKVIATARIYSHATTSVTEGPHTITAPRLVMIYLYGHYTADNRGMSYGYPAGFQDLSYYTTSQPDIKTTAILATEASTTATTTVSSTSSTTTSFPSVTSIVPGNCGNDTLCAAFSVGRNASQGTGIIFYNVVVLNDGNGFDMVTSSFAAPVSGLYWLASSSGVEIATKSDQYLVGVDRLSRLTVSSATNNGIDTVSRDGLFYLSDQCSDVQTIALYPVFSDSFLQTSLSGFNLYSVTEPSSVVAFSVALSIPAACASGTRVPFDVVLLDTINAWNSASHEYVISETGAYVISLTVGSRPSQQYAVGLYSASTAITTVQLSSTNHDYETGNQLVIVDLDSQQSVFLGCMPQYSISYLHSSVDYQTTMHGFLYRPKLAPLVWSVATTTSLTGYVYPIPYPSILINRGGGWDPVRQRYLVLQSGVYYIHLTGSTLANQPLKVELLLNGTPIVNVDRTASEHNGVRLRSRAIIWRLSQGNLLTARLPAGYSLYGGNDRVSTFSGFRLYE